MVVIVHPSLKTGLGRCLKKWRGLGEGNPRKRKQTGFGQCKAKARRVSDAAITVICKGK